MFERGLNDAMLPQPAARHLAGIGIAIPDVRQPLSTACPLQKCSQNDACDSELARTCCVAVPVDVREVPVATASLIGANSDQAQGSANG